MCPLAAIAVWCVLAVSTPALPQAAGMDFVAQSVLLPNVVGERFGAAARRLKKLGLATERRRITSSRPAGEVIQQEPEAGTDIGSIKLVTLFVSSGAPATAGTPSAMPTMVATSRPAATLPDFVGETFGSAARRAKALGLTTQRQGISSNRSRGEVLQQNPQAGVELRSIKVVRLTVSNGAPAIAATNTPAPAVPLPNFVGDSFAFAQSYLTKVRLTTQRRAIPSDRPPGEVVAQDPGPGVDIRRIRTVALTVSGGSRPTKAPSVPQQPPVAIVPVASATAESVLTPPGSRPVRTPRSKVPTIPPKTAPAAPSTVAAVPPIAPPASKAPPPSAAATTASAPTSKSTVAPQPTAVPTVPNFVGRSSADALRLAAANGRPPHNKVPPWTPVLIFGAVLGLSLAAKTWSHAHSVEKTRRLLAIQPSLDLSGPTNFPTGVQTAGPTVEVKTRVEPGETSFHGLVPIVRKETRHD